LCRATTLDEHCRCFFDWISTTSTFSIFPKKAIGPDASGKAFGSSGRVRQGIWGCPGGVQEASWGALGVSAGVRGASWESLGRSWGDLGTTFSAVGFRIDFWVDLERQKGAQREAFEEAKGSQNRSQNDPQTALNRRRFSTATKTLFKTVLEHSWVDLRPS